MGRPNQENIIKCVVVGDLSVSKRRLISSLTNDLSSEEDELPVFVSNSVANVTVDGKPFQIALWDTTGQEDADRLRPLSYPQTDVFLICFSIASPSSFVSAYTKWASEITQWAPHTPIIFVGTQSELRNDAEANRQLAAHGLQAVGTDEAHDKAFDIKAFKYVECSINTREGLNIVLDEAARACVNNLKNLKSKKESCVIC